MHQMYTRDIRRKDQVSEKRADDDEKQVYRL